MESKDTRRSFLKKTALAAGAVTYAMTAKSYANILGANDRIRVAMIGCNRRFNGLAPAVGRMKNAEISYVCDVDARRQEKAVGKVKEWTGTAPKAEKDLRKILEDQQVDAIFNATPDHWHAAGAWLAMQAGKHVYLEKPSHHNPKEGELLMAYQEKFNRLVQVGNQQRSSAQSQEVIKAIHDGEIGRAYHAVAFYSNKRGRVPNPQEVDVPEWLDWELFQGPAPRRPYLDVLGDYNWHWFWHWGTAETGNNALHELDIARWALQVEYPNEVKVFAAKQHFQDDGWTMYDTMDANFTFEGEKTIKWDGKSRNGFGTYKAGRGTIIYGTEGTVWMDRGGYKMYDRSGKLVNEAKMNGNEGGTNLGGGGDLTTRHVRNFFESIRGKEKLNSPITEGAVSTQLCHYANISYRLGNAALEIDPQTGHFAKGKVMKQYWGRDYEKGWEPPRIS
ncbi:Gfo/Idh/MocA family oxidoreductase [Pontibacter sp. G13]|uniref:Gfo/Idh/MocA family protein n=1 Tax=Pontibacter sp. G13 TaxID=3074898 RepID=UPI00288ACD30|nr:Gfo/Idh/MocA family oxidoreductase [Pontibacter sp. G13]WNJ17344.1 Gfo/Idh/MocA family oxidoreductase [Pontibacter sp. G13]